VAVGVKAVNFPVIPLSKQPHLLLRQAKQDKPYSRNSPSGNSSKWRAVEPIC
jgi:hypothetical protein